MTMSIGASTTILLVAYVISVVLCVLLYLRCVALECKVDVVQESKEALRESLTKHNYSLFQEKEKLEKEVADKDAEIERLTKKVATLEGELSDLRENSSKHN